MNLLPQRVLSFQEVAFSAVNTDKFAEANSVAIDVAPPLTLVDMQIFAADNAGLFQLGCNDGGVRGLTAAGGKKPLGQNGR